MAKKSKIIILSCLFVFFLLFSSIETGEAFLGTAECTSKGGSCDVTCWSFSGDYESLGMCDYGALNCCRKKQVNTSGADPDPKGTGNFATGTCGSSGEGTCKFFAAIGGTICGDGKNIGQDICSWGYTCCIPTTNTGVGSTNPTTGNPTAGASPSIAPAGTANPSGASSGARTGSTGGLVPCTDDCTLCHLVLGFKNIYDYLLTLLLVATTLVVVVAGVMYMVSSGNKGMLDKAKAALTYAITAMILALVAWLIINTTLNALGYNNAGNWWTFTCDTTQSAPQASTGAGGSTLPGNTPPSAPGTPGNCGGMSTTVQNQCVLASAALQSMLSCMSGKGATGTITSVTGSTVGGNFEKSKACCGTGNCPHASMTCHYGCGMSDQGYSHAVDVSTSGWSDDQLLKLASIAKECGSGKIWGKKTMGDITYWQGHGTHLHISTGACGH